MAKAKKKALLIGVNRYKVPGANLRGCVNDVENMKSVLGRFYGFGQRDIKTLVDYRATKARMESEIIKLIDGAKSGDVLYLHFSGHGSNVPDKNGDEAEGRDEILCPTNLDWRDPMLDDWIRKTFDSLAAGVNLTVVFDCCHSGSATRAIRPPDAPEIPRFLACPLDLMAAESGRSLRGTTRGTRAERRRTIKPVKDVEAVDIPEVLITGCRDYQTSADAFIKGSYHGALTYNLVAAIKAKRGKLTYRELHAEAKARVKKGGFRQVPQLEGEKSRLDHPFLAPL